MPAGGESLYHALRAASRGCRGARERGRAESRSPRSGSRCGPTDGWWLGDDRRLSKGYEHAGEIVIDLATTHPMLKRLGFGTNAFEGRGLPVALMRFGAGKGHGTRGELRGQFP